MRIWLLVLGVAVSAVVIACGTDTPATAPAPTATELTIVVQTVVTEPGPPLSGTPEPTPNVPEPAVTASPDEPAAGSLALPELIVTEGSLRLADKGGVFAELLGFLPDTVDTRKIIIMRDFIPQWEAAAELGFERPDPEGDPAAIEGFIRGVFGAGGFFGGVLGEAFLCCPRDYQFSHQPLDDIGFDTRNVDSALWAGEPPREFTVVQGIYDPAVTAARIAACVDCVAHELRERNGLEYYRWNDDGRGDLRERFAPPLLDHIGRGGRIHVGDGFAMHSYFDADMEGMIDAVTSNGVSLIDLEKFQLAARALMGVEATNAAIAPDGFGLEAFNSGSRRSFGYGPTPNLTSEETEQIIFSAPLLAPFSLAAIVSLDERRTSPGDTILILTHETEEAAQINSERLPGRLRLATEQYNSLTADGVILAETGFWGDLVGSVEISVDGKVLIARLSTRDGVPESVLLPYIVLDRAGVLIYE